MYMSRTLLSLLQWRLQGSMCVSAAGDAVEELYVYGEHKSLAYGIDWSRLTLSNTETETPSISSLHLLASCSFYDHSLHFWTADIPN